MKKTILKYFGFLAFVTIILTAGMKIDASQCNHDWIADETCYTDNGDGTHTVSIGYDCYKCDDFKLDEKVENCDLKYSFSSAINSEYHENEYFCHLCEGSVIEKEKHEIGWQRYKDYYYYGCSKCDYCPLYNGVALDDRSYKNNVTIKKNAKYEEYLDNYHPSKNKIKSIKISNKKICAVSHKKDTLYIKGKKKGKCTVTVKMQSGATYNFPVKVK